MNAFKIASSSLTAALREVRAWLAAWLLVTVPALLLVQPLFAALAKDLDHHPGAAVGLNRHLDADFLRHHPELAAGGLGAVLCVLLGWSFLSGGILACAGTRTRLADFLAACARLLPANLRVLAVGLLLALLLGWGVDFLDGWLKDEVLADVDPSAQWMPLGLRFPWLTLGYGPEALGWLYGFLFLLLVFLAKVARAQLCVLDRRSAALAWLRALGLGLRHPLRLLLVVGTMGAVWILGQVVAFLLQSALGEQLWLLLLVGQGQVVLTQVVLVGLLLAARRFAGLEGRAHAPGIDLEQPSLA